MSDAMRAGTTAADDRDGTQVQTGTPQDADGNAGGADVEALRSENERLKAAHAQALAEKNTQEALRREVEELRARVASPPNAGAAGVQDPRVGLQAIMANRIQQHMAAAMSDPANAQDSALVVGLWQQNQQLAQQIAEVRAMQAVPIEEQEKVLNLQREYAQRGESISPGTARKLLGIEKSGTSAQETKQRDAEQARLDEERAANRVATRTVGVGAGDVPQKTMKMSEYVRRTDAMTPKEAREFDRKLSEAGTQVLPED
jgi:hypothetical protein